MLQNVQLSGTSSVRLSSSAGCGVCHRFLFKAFSQGKLLFAAGNEANSVPEPTKRSPDHFATAPTHCFSVGLQDRVKSQRPSHQCDGSMTTSPSIRSRQIWICAQPGIHNKAESELNEERRNICWDLEPRGESRGATSCEPGIFLTNRNTHLLSGCVCKVKSFNSLI